MSTPPHPTPPIHPPLIITTSMYYHVVFCFTNPCVPTKTVTLARSRTRFFAKTGGADGDPEAVLPRDLRAEHDLPPSGEKAGTGRAEPDEPRHGAEEVLQPPVPYYVSSWDWGRVGRLVSGGIFVGG